MHADVRKYNKQLLSLASLAIAEQYLCRPRMLRPVGADIEGLGHRYLQQPAPDQEIGCLQKLPKEDRVCNKYTKHELTVSEGGAKSCCAQLYWLVPEAGLL